MQRVWCVSNPKKCVFSTNQGKILGHIVSKNGFKIDLERVEAILSLPLPIHKTRLEIFLGRINFIRRFTPDLASMLKSLIAMLKKNLVFTWTKEGKASFEEIKQSIASTTTLVNPNFDRDFIMYSLGGKSSILGVLTYLNDENLKQPISFFSEGLNDYEERYNYVEKQVLADVRDLKKFKNIFSNKKVQLLVSYASVKDFLLNKDINEKRARWITRFMEYDIDIKITKLVRGKRLCEKMASSFERHEEVFLLIQNEKLLENEDKIDQLQDMAAFFIEGRCPHGLDRSKRRQFRLHANPYVLVDRVLFKKDSDGVLLRCIQIEQVSMLLKEFHDGPTGGHFLARVTLMKIMRAGYYWLTLFNDYHKWVRKCEKCSFYWKHGF